MGRNKKPATTEVAEKRCINTRGKTSKSIKTPASQKSDGKPGKQKSGNKRSASAMADAQQPTTKQTKVAKILTNNTDEAINNNVIAEPVVSSAKSLINSIEEGRIGNRKARLSQEAHSSQEADSSKQQFDRNSSILMEDADISGDGVQVAVNTSDEEEYEEVDREISQNEQMTDSSSESEISQEEGEYSTSVHSTPRGSEVTFKRQKKMSQADRSQRESDTDLDGDEQQQLIQLRNDPAVKKLLSIMMKDDKQARRSSETKTKGMSSKRRDPKVVKQSVNGSNLKSPSDTTIYAPALHKQVPYSSPVNVQKRVRVDDQDNIMDQVSQFVERVRLESQERERQRNSRSVTHSPRPGTSVRRRRHSRTRTRSPSSSDSRSRSRTRSRSRSRRRSRSRSKRSDRSGNRDNRGKGGPAEQMVIQAEKFKEAIIPPKGKTFENDFDKLVSMVKQKIEDDNADEKFFHIACHVDSALKGKIKRGEYIDLERLLPKDRAQTLFEDNPIEVVRRSGSTYVLPPLTQKDSKITNVRRWEQAFQVYAAIYSQANPSRSAEIWQYVYIINKASQSFVWENVSYYDTTFRQLMHENPDRSWAKTYTHLWTLAMVNPLTKQHGHTSNNHNNNNYGNGQSGDWKERCCWRFNKGKCSKWNCNWDHRCNICGGWSHGKSTCRKKKDNNT